MILGEYASAKTILIKYLCTWLGVALLTFRRSGGDGGGGGGGATEKDIFRNALI
jgi:hypothetical protein